MVRPSFRFMDVACSIAYCHHTHALLDEVAVQEDILLRENDMLNLRAAIRHGSCSWRVGELTYFTPTFMNRRQAHVCYFKYFLSVQKVQLERVSLPAKYMY